jgi:hypothetical protein
VRHQASERPAGSAPRTPGSTRRTPSKKELALREAELYKREVGRIVRALGLWGMDRELRSPLDAIRNQVYARAVEAVLDSMSSKEIYAKLPDGASLDDLWLRSVRVVSRLAEAGLDVQPELDVSLPPGEYLRFRTPRQPRGTPKRDQPMIRAVIGIEQDRLLSGTRRSPYQVRAAARESLLRSVRVRAERVEKLRTRLQTLTEALIPLVRSEWDAEVTARRRCRRECRPGTDRDHVSRRDGSLSLCPVVWSESIAEAVQRRVLFQRRFTGGKDGAANPEEYLVPAVKHALLAVRPPTKMGSKRR